MDPSKLKTILILALAAFGALYLGIGAATAQFETIGWIAGGTVLATCVLLGRKIWLLIPLLGSLNLTLMIPGRPTTMMVAESLVITFCVLMLLIRRLPYALRFTELEFWMALLALCVLQVYVRHPVGVSLFGGSQIGGRPYFLFAAALVTSLILAGLIVPPAQLRTALKLSIISGILNFVIGFVGWLWMPFGYYFGTAAAEINPEQQRELADPGQAGRVGFIVFIPITLARWVSSFVSPLKACFSPRWAPLVLLSLGLAAASGYRNVVAAVGLTYLVGLFYRGGLAALVGSALAGVAALAMLGIVNITMPLPPEVQRSLSFLPGTWDERYVSDSKDSTEWRVDMWKEVLTSDRWIENKILGDGLGFSARELEYQGQLQATGRLAWAGESGFDLSREFVLINGDYHSGPVSAIRTIGYVGLAVMVFAMLRLAVHAHRQIMRCRGTEWYPVALFFGIPIIWYPFFFVFIFGGFQNDAILILLNAGMLRLIENNLPLPAYSSAQQIPLAHSPRGNPEGDVGAA